MAKSKTEDPNKDKDKKKAEERDTGNWFKNALTSILPVNAVAMGQSLMGSTDPISEKFFNDEELDYMRTVIETAKADGRNYVTYDDYPTEENVDKADDISHFTGPSSKVRTTLGQFNFKDTGDGGYTIDDQYDFNPTSRDAHNIFGIEEEELKEMSSTALMALGTKYYMNKGENPTQAAYHATRYWVAPYKQGEPIPVNINLTGAPKLPEIAPKPKAKNPGKHPMLEDGGQLNQQPMKQNSRKILPSFITPSSPGLKRFEDGGEIGGVEQEGIAGKGSNIPTGMFSSINAIGNELIDKQWEDPAHGVNTTKETIKTFQTRSGQFTDIGGEILPGWGHLIGAAVGGTIGLTEGLTGSKKANDEYSAQFQKDYNNIQAQELDPLFARDGGMLYDDGGQLPMLAKNGALPGTYNEYHGNGHEAGGIAIGDAEVETGEVRWNDYIFSDSLQPAKNFTV